MPGDETLTLTLTLTQREAEALTKMSNHFSFDDARKLAASHPEAYDILNAVQKLQGALRHERLRRLKGSGV